MKAEKKEKLPCNLELEQAILGCMLLYDNARLQLIDELSREDFFYTENQNIFSYLQFFQKEHEEDKNKDLISFLIFLRDKNLIENCKDEKYITDLVDKAPLIDNLDIYLNMLKPLTIRRKAIAESEKVIERAKNTNEDITTTVDLSISSFVNLSNDATKGKGCINGASITRNIRERIEKYGLETPATTLIPSGFRELDRMIGGFRQGQLSIIGARPSVGKTAFSLSLALNILTNYINVISETEDKEITREKRRPKVGFYSLEMPKEDIVLRLASSLSCANASFVYGTKRITDKAIESRIKNGLKVLEEDLLKNFFIYDNSKMDIATLRSSIRALKVKEDIDIVFIDYLQLIDTSKSRANELWERIQEVSILLKGLAKELEIPIVCLSQLNRDAESKKPNLANLRNSGSIEQDADLIIFLHDSEREKKERNYKGCYYSLGIDSFECEEARLTDVIIAKQRNGETGEFKLMFLSDFVRFAEVEDCRVFEERSKGDD